ncbi:MAG: hypothetical protein M3R41_06210 [Pseudomonadota bacterium]|nr:hypothetical protein [Pseudomonadota bacterium]
MKVQLLALATVIAAVPATAQVVGPADPSARAIQKVERATGEISKNAPVNGVLTLYGNQRCPTDSSGNEVVVCQRRNASEQFRIPKEVREFQVTPENESWASKVVAHDSVGDTGVGSCSTVGPGGSTGCFLKQAQATKRDNQAKKDADRHVEESLP